MKTTELIAHIKRAIEQARVTRDNLTNLCIEVEREPAAHAHSAELYGVISELRETLRHPSMRAAEAQRTLYRISPLGRALNAAHFEGAERAREAP